MGKSALKMLLILATSIVFICLILPLEGNAQENTKPITIDNMRSLSGWNIYPPINNCSCDLSGSDKGIKISYEINPPGGWVDIYKNMSFGAFEEQFGEITEISFGYSGEGAPNTLEFKLGYGDGDEKKNRKQTEFRYDLSNAINTSETGKLTSLHFPCWQGACDIGKDFVDFNKVQQVRFAVVNMPGDKLGKGSVTIGRINATIIPKIPFDPETIAKIITAIAAIVVAIYSIIKLISRPPGP
jgi:hypothetical protein